MYNPACMQTAIVIAVLFLGTFTQSATGFGIGLVSMSLLPVILPIQTASPLVALAALTLEGVLLLRYRSAFNLKAIWQVSVGSVIGVPVGIWALKQVDEKIVLMILGVVILGYAAYALLALHLPALDHPIWSYGIGLLAGMLGGAYNTAGPPVIIYGDCRRWLPAEFKSNLQGFFLVNSTVVLSGHLIAHTITPAIGRLYLQSLPFMAAAVLAGVTLDRYLDPLRFRKIVLVLLAFMGLRLILA